MEYESETAEMVSLFNSINKKEIRKIAIEQLRLLSKINVRKSNIPCCEINHKVI